MYDYVLAADCIYHEHLVRSLFRVVLALTGERSTGELCLFVWFVWCVVLVFFRVLRVISDEHSQNNQNSNQQTTKKT